MGKKPAMTYEEAQERCMAGLPMRRQMWREWDQTLMWGRGEFFLELSRSERTGWRPTLEDKLALDWEVAP